jgi:hypothetical protein
MNVVPENLAGIVGVLDAATRAARTAAVGSSSLRISEMSARSVMSTAAANVPRRG